MSIVNYTYKSYPYGMYRMKFKKSSSGDMYIKIIADTNNPNTFDFRGYYIHISSVGIIYLNRRIDSIDTLMVSYLIPNFSDQQEYNLVVTREESTNYFSMYVSNMLVTLSNEETYYKDTTFGKSDYEEGCYLCVTGTPNNSYDYVDNISIVNKVIEEYIYK